MLNEQRDKFCWNVLCTSIFWLILGSCYLYYSDISWYQCVSLQLASEHIWSGQTIYLFGHIWHKSLVSCSDARFFKVRPSLLVWLFFNSFQNVRISLIYSLTICIYFLIDQGNFFIIAPILHYGHWTLLWVWLLHTTSWIFWYMNEA